MIKESYINMNILSIDEAKKFLPETINSIRTRKVVIITGVTGQDGSFMVDYLLKNTNCEIFGGARRLSVHNHANIKHLEKVSRFHLINFDLTDSHSINQLVNQLKPDYFINFAAQSFVKSSWDFPAQTWETNTTGVLHILEAVRLHAPQCKVYSAGSSEEMGNVEYSPQNEKHPIRPRSPYGASKAAARQLIKVYRESYNLYAVQAWLYNHESERRGEEFVTRKITKGIAGIFNSIKNNIEFDSIELGNLNAKRDWSHAEDMIDAVWRMLHQEDFNDLYSTLSINEMSKHVKEYVVSSGETHEIREFVEEGFKCIGIIGKWEGSGLDEKFIYVSGAINPPINNILVKVNPAFYRPAEVELLLGDSSNIRNDLKWNPKVSYKELAKRMIMNDLQ